MVQEGKHPGVCICSGCLDRAFLQTNHIVCRGIGLSACRGAGCMSTICGAGSGLGRLDAALIFEALAYGWVTTTAYLTVSQL